LLIRRYGLADAGLVVTASKLRALVLTDDRRLANDYTAGGGYQIQLLDDYLATAY
jgi:hypothetical protein